VASPAQGAIQHLGRPGKERLHLGQEDGDVVGARAPGGSRSDRAHAEEAGVTGRVMLAGPDRKRQARPDAAGLCMTRRRARM
jgi:hypothetical protein